MSIAPNFLRTARRLRAALLAPMVVLGFSQSAAAFPHFPSDLRDALDMACTPNCSICHTSDPGVKGNATQLFARALIEAGTGFPNGGSDEAVADAAGSLRNDRDSDGDGFVDLDELAGRVASGAGSGIASDPNVATLTPEMPGDGICAAVVEYGCGAHVASQPMKSYRGVSPFAALALAFGAMWALRRGTLRRRRTRPR